MELNFNLIFRLNLKFDEGVIQKFCVVTRHTAFKLVSRQTCFLHQLVF